MAVKFLEPGGDADFGTSLWPTTVGTAPVVATDFVHGSHIKSLKYAQNTYSGVIMSNLVVDAGGRCSVYFYFNTLPGATMQFVQLEQSSDGVPIIGVQITSGGVLQLCQYPNGGGSASQVGSNGATLSTGVWYRLCLAWKITSSTVNQIILFKDGSSSISLTNVTLNNTSSADFQIANASNDATVDFRTSDHYLDNSNSMTDTGNIWVTAKRPNANGGSNAFTTRIGSGGSGYGSGHSPQVNERPSTTANGWSITTVATPITEEYNIESASTGDIDISAATIVDYMGWLFTKAVLSETAKIIVNNVQTSISIPTNAVTLFTQIAGSSTYPAGTGTDIGEISSNTATTISLYECGIIFAYTPAVASSTPRRRSLLGVGL